MNIGKEIYEALVRHCGGEEKVLGTNPSTLRQLKEGSVNPNTKTLGKLFQLNKLKAEIVLHVHPEQGTGKTKLTL